MAYMIVSPMTIVQGGIVINVWQNAYYPKSPQRSVGKPTREIFARRKPSLIIFARKNMQRMDVVVVVIIRVKTVLETGLWKK